MRINNEKEFYKFLRQLVNEKRITADECEALEHYVCGLFDALSGLGIYEEDI